jgi:hypothetical protein
VFVILIGGFIVVFAALMTEVVYQPPYWVHAALWLPLILIVTLIVTPFGLWWAGRQSHARLTAVAGLLIFTLFLLLNAAYEHWEGGWAYGPRHLVPALGFLCVGFAVLWDRLPGWGRFLLAAGIGYGIVCSLVGVAVTPQPPDPYGDPMRELLWPAFRAGKLAINNQSFFDIAAPDGWAGLRPSGVSWNLGERMGLHGLVSLLPLLAFWLVCALAWPQSSDRRSQALSKL